MNYSLASTTTIRPRIFLAAPNWGDGDPGRYGDFLEFRAASLQAQESTWVFVFSRPRTVLFTWDR
ncbi:MAG: hypothetical protein WBD31_04425, partial [Rubripirellula sp.]